MRWAHTHAPCAIESHVRVALTRAVVTAALISQKTRTALVDVSQKRDGSAMHARGHSDVCI